MQSLFGSSFSTGTAESREQVKKLAKQPTLCETSEKVLNQVDIDELVPTETTSLKTLIMSDDQLTNTTKKDKGFFIIKVPESSS